MEAVYYAARANLRCLMMSVPAVDASSVCPGAVHVRALGQEMEETLAGGRPGGRAGAAQSLAGTRPSAGAHQSSGGYLILQMRDEPPEGLRRTPGPEALLFNLSRD